MRKMCKRIFLSWWMGDFCSASFQLVFVLDFWKRKKGGFIFLFSFLGTSSKIWLILKSNYLIHSSQNLQQLTHLTQQPLLRAPGAAPGLRRFHSAQFFILFFRIAILEKIRIRILKIPDQEFWIL